MSKPRTIDVGTYPERAHFDIVLTRRFFTLYTPKLNEKQRTVAAAVSAAAGRIFAGLFWFSATGQRLMRRTIRILSRLTSETYFSFA